MYSCTFSCSSGGCCLLVEGQAKINFSCPHKLLPAWMRILLTFVISSVSWVLATNMPESSYCFGNATETQDTYACIMVGQNLGWIFVNSSAPTVLSWWRQWVVMAGCHCCSWRGDGLTHLWVTLIMLWLHSVSCCLQSVVLEFSLQSHRYVGCSRLESQISFSSTEWFPSSVHSKCQFRLQVFLVFMLTGLLHSHGPS
jgi:hypothetical protein